MDMDHQILLKIAEYEKQEAVLKFEHFSNDDALDLGLALVDYAKKHQYPVAIEITVNAHQVFKYAFEGATSNNDEWMRRKRNAVNAFHHASMLLGAKLASKNEDMEKDHRVSEKDFAFHGGGFPIYLIGTGIIGTVCVSGLPQEDDHQMIVNVLCEYLGKEIK